MDDLISRQAAIDALNEYFARIGKLKRGGLNKGEKAISLDTVGAIKTLPSAQPDVSDRKVGEWIVVQRHEHYPSGKPYEQVQCPFCKRLDNNGDGSFCGYCGARMKGE